MENPSSLLLPRRLIRQSGETTNEGQRTLEVEERGALAALQVLDPTAPAGTFGQPLVPYADDKGADGGSWRGFNHKFLLVKDPLGFGKPKGSPRCGG